MVGPYGTITWWGFSPALDLQEEYKKLRVQDSKFCDTDPISILLVGSGDCRHLLKTLAKAHQWKRKHINIYVVENNLELYARHLLLLGIALEPTEKLGLQEKCELFLELFGNTLIRPQASEYLQEKSNEFIKMVTNLDYMEDNFPLVNMSLLKFKERDMLEAVFKFWRNTDPKYFDITKCWDLRLRNHLAVRYDCRNNVYDWDYNMTLHKKAPIIRFHEYKMWREQGVAFELREDSSYGISNRSLASGMVVNKGSEKFASRGYWGDVINSPFFAFGIESDEKSLFEKKNDVHVKTAQDVSAYNITVFTYELIHHKKYKPPKETTDEKRGQGRIKEVTEEVEELQITGTENPEQTHPVIGCIPTENVSIHFLPLNCIPDLQKKTKFQQLFHMVYFSNSMVHLLTPETSCLLSEKAMLIIETTMFMLDLKEEQSEEYLKKVTAMAQRAGCEPMMSCDPTKHPYVYYQSTKL